MEVIYRLGEKEEGEMGRGRYHVAQKSRRVYSLEERRV